MIELKNRIQTLIGTNDVIEDDYSFLQPGGNDHLVQFLYKNFSDEYWELDDWNRNSLLVIDISAILGLNFVLDDDAQFASLVVKNTKGHKLVQAILDLRDEFVVIAYYFGESKTCLKINRKFVDFPLLCPCFFNSNHLIGIARDLEIIKQVEYHFEQPVGVFESPIIMKGTFSGRLVKDIFNEYVDKFRDFFNIVFLAGHLTDGTQGTISFQSNGTVKVDACRLTSFLEIVESLFVVLKEKYRILVSEHIISWESLSNGFLKKYNGTPIEYELPYSIDNMEILSRSILKGSKTMELFGIAEKMSRKQWSVKVTEVKTASQLEIELSNDLIRVILREKNAIPLLEKLESYFRHNISAQFESVLF